LAVATQTAQPPTSTPTLDPASIVASLGDKGPYVTAIQYLLRAEGYALDTSGIFDPATEALVIQFQARQGLRADGIIEHETLTALVREHELEMGDQGDDVRALQYVLVQRCRAGIPIDGVFGESTRRAVIRFQTFNVGSFFDGIVGQTTWRSLISDRYCD
jgi:peptidoglycan hydrolase-like protein with peptidoglycan-binding domain